MEKKNRILSAVVSCGVTVAMGLSSVVSVYANEDEVSTTELFNKVETLGSSATSSLTVIAFTVCILSVIIGALMLMLTKDSRKVSEIVRFLGWVAIGAFLVAVAPHIPSVIKGIASAVTGSSGG